MKSSKFLKSSDASRFLSVFSVILTFRLLPEPLNVFPRSRLRGSFQSMIECSRCQKLKLAFILEIERAQLPLLRLSNRG